MHSDSLLDTLHFALLNSIVFISRNLVLRVRTILLFTMIELLFLCKEIFNIQNKQHVLFIYLFVF